MDASLSWKQWLREWVILALGILVAANMVSGIHYEKTSALVLTVLVLSLLNSAIRPVLTAVFMALSFPLLIVTLGLGVLFVMWFANSILLYLTGAIIPHFTVTTFGDAMWGALIISLVSFVFNTLLGRAAVTPKNKTPRHRSDDDVIDI